MFAVVAKKSRTFSSFSYSANEQVGRSWVGAEPGSWPKLPYGNIPYHRHHALVYNWGLAGGQDSSFTFIFVQEFKLFHEFSLFFQEFCKVRENT